jgi:hypothetical protein
MVGLQAPLLSPDMTFTAKAGFETLLAEIRSRLACAESVKLSANFFSKPDFSLGDWRKAAFKGQQGGILIISGGTKHGTSGINRGVRTC